MPSIRFIVKSITFILFISLILNKTGFLTFDKEISFNDVKILIKKDHNYFRKIVIDEYNNKVYFFGKNTDENYTLKISKNRDFSVKLESILSEYSTTEITYISSQLLSSYLFNIFFYVMVIYVVLNIFGILLLQNNVFKNNPLMNNNHKFQVEKDIDIKFKDIVGQTSAKKDLKECIKFFKYREKYISAGYKIPKGMIFTGSPGTGKTLLAKAFAGEANVTFISVCGSDFIEIFVGVGSQRIRKMFQYARKHSPAIIFIDEIDAIGRKRNKYVEGHNEHGSTLNKLLSEMDGFTSNDNIMVIAATNISTVLDSALIRSGRFDKEIIFDAPNKEERVQLFQMYLEKVRLDSSFKDNMDQNLVKLSSMTAGLNGADIANIVNQSAATYMQRIDIDDDKYNSDNIDLDGVIFDDIEKSIDIFLIGMEKRERKMTPEEKKIVSYHESGHTLISYLLKSTNPPVKVSIIPRGKSALGFTLQEPTDQKLYTKQQLMGKICILMGGRAAEQLVFKHFSTGASDDIEKASLIAHNMIVNYGMGSIGPINLYFEKSQEYSTMMSEKMKEKIDMEIQQLLNDLYERTLNLLSTNFDKLEILSNHLHDNEILLQDDLDNLLSSYNIKNSIELQ